MWPFLLLCKHYKYAATIYSVTPPRALMTSHLQLLMPDTRTIDIRYPVELHVIESEYYKMYSCNVRYFMHKPSVVIK